jgi:hypothetical protein
MMIFMVNLQMKLSHSGQWQSMARFWWKVN